MPFEDTCEACPIIEGGEASDCRQLIIAGYCGKWMMGEAPDQGLDIFIRENKGLDTEKKKPSIDTVQVNKRYL